jgi:hypothetical protein
MQMISTQMKVDKVLAGQPCVDRLQYRHGTIIDKYINTATSNVLGEFDSVCVQYKDCPLQVLVRNYVQFIVVLYKID